MESRRPNAGHHGRLVADARSSPSCGSAAVDSTARCGSPTLDDALNPVFAPDGAAVILSGNAGGVIDLYRLTIATGALERLTSDPYADLEAAVTPDGRGVVFVTERFSTNLETLEPGPLRLAYLDLATRAVPPDCRVPPREAHQPAGVRPTGGRSYFIADPDGVNNLYRMSHRRRPDRAAVVARHRARPASRRRARRSVWPRPPAGSCSACSRTMAMPSIGSTRRMSSPGVARGVDVGVVLPGRTTPGGDVQALLTNSAPRIAAAGSRDLGRGRRALSQPARRSTFWASRRSPGRSSPVRHPRDGRDLGRLQRHARRPRARRPSAGWRHVRRLRRAAAVHQPAASMELGRIDRGRAREHRLFDATG